MHEITESGMNWSLCDYYNECEIQQQNLTKPKFEWII